MLLHSDTSCLSLHLVEGVDLDRGQHDRDLEVAVLLHRGMLLFRGDLVLAPKVTNNP